MATAPSKRSRASRGTERLGGELQWRNYGPRVRITGPAGPHVIASFESAFAYLTVGPLKGIPDEPRTRAVERLKTVNGVATGRGDASLRWESTGGDAIQRFFEIARDLLGELASRA